MKVRDIMEREVVEIKAEATVDEAIKKMLDEMITSLIVNSKEGYGILTRKDIIHKVIGEGKNPKKIKVAEVMSHPLLTVPPEMSLEDVARLMAKTDIRRFPVMDEGKLIGLVSNSDIIKAISDTIKED
jgi:CBS domain-containing protein